MFKNYHKAEKGTHNVHTKNDFGPKFVRLNIFADSNVFGPKTQEWTNNNSNIAS